MKRKSQLWRFCEIFPGAVAWTLIISPVILSFFWPFAVAIYVLIFDLYWLFRALYMAWYLQLSFKKMRSALHTDFGRKLTALPKNDPKICAWQDIYQCVIFATFKEELETLLPSVESVVNASWNHQKKIIVLAGEERDKERLHRIGNYLKDKFKTKLFDFIISEHPDGITGELRGKGAGSAWAGKVLTKYALERGLDEQNIVVHIADADTRFSHQYFNAVAYEFVTNPNRHRRSFQPIPLYSNNIWRANPVCRLSAWGSSFWQMVEASRPWRLVNFSTHAYSLKMLREMDYWAVDIVNEDSRQFWRAYFAFDGDHKAVPIYIPVHMDAVFADNLWTTLKNQYLQKRRWAYGIEHFPYIISESIKHKEIPFWDKFIKIWRLLEGTISWSTASFYLMVVGWLPIVISQDFRHTVLATNMPMVTRIIFPLTWIGIMVSVYVSLSFLPPRPSSIKKTTYLIMLAEWAILPLTAVLFGSIPALEAQTRLMLGKYMGFWVTPKSVHPVRDEAENKSVGNDTNFAVFSGAGKGDNDNL